MGYRLKLELDNNDKKDIIIIFFKKKNQSYFPLPFKTTKKVLKAILKSSQKLQLSIYVKSILTQSSKFSIEFLPLTCQRPVIPGFILCRL